MIKTSQIKVFLDKLIKIAIVLAAIFALYFYYNQNISGSFDKTLGLVKPLITQTSQCSQPIDYTLGTFDNKFGLTKTEFLADVKLAEAIWEKPLGKNLFDYAESGKLKINLIYDYRQEATDKLKRLGITIGDTQASYDSLRLKYESLAKDYDSKKAALDKSAADYNTRKAAYEQEVAYWNDRGGAPQGKFQQIEADRVALNNAGATLNNAQTDLKNLADEINAVVSVLNRTARELNLNVKNYNTIGATTGPEFQEGEYVSDDSGERINIYQFDSKDRLVRVLAHELGHALGLEHNDNPASIMYRLNEGKNEKLSADDIKAVDNLCGVK